jgi:GT2 family glycosyltransferase
MIPTIAVLLTCHNRKDKTIQCLTHLFEQQSLNEDFKIEVFLVDDASTDSTAESIKKQFPKVYIIQGNGTLYWNRGMHLAWQTAIKVKDFDYYLWLNDDTFLYEQAISNLLEAADQTQNESAICGSTISLESKKISYGGNSKEGALLIPNGSLQETYSFNGNVVLVPKFVYDKVGILDPRFPHAIGDFEYALRIRKNKLKSFISKDFVGSCEGNEKLPSWCSPSLALPKRIQSLYSPLGNSHPYYFFIFELKHYGLFTAIKHFFTIHIRLLFPQLWLKKNN